MQQHFDQPHPAATSRSSNEASAASTTRNNLHCRLVEDELVAAVEAASKGDATALEHSARVERVRKAVAALQTLANVPLPPRLPPTPAPTFDGTPQTRTIEFQVAGAPQRPPPTPSLSALILKAVLADSPPPPRNIPVLVQRDIAHSFTARSGSPAPLRLSRTTSSPLLVLSTSPPSHWARMGEVDLDPEEVRNWRNSTEGLERKGRKDSCSSTSTTTLNSRRNSLFMSSSSIFSTPSTSFESHSSLAPSLRTRRPTYSRSLSAPTKPRPAFISSRTKPRVGNSTWVAERRKLKEAAREESGEEGKGRWLVRWLVGRFS